MRYAFPCNIIRDKLEEEATGREAYTVTIPDVYGANTCGWSWGEAVEMAEDCLAVALSFYIDDNEDIPTPSPLAAGQVAHSRAAHRSRETHPLRCHARTRHNRQGTRR